MLTLRKCQIGTQIYFTIYLRPFFLAKYQKTQGKVKKMSKKGIKNAKERIIEILAKREAEEATLQKLIEKDIEAVKVAFEAMADATNANDVEAYREAKAAKMEASDAKEMHENRLETLQEKELITKAEYEQLCGDIFAEVAALDDETKKKIAKLAEEASEIGNILCDAINEANATLKKLQFDIYRCADMPKNSSGERIHANVKAVRYWDTYNWSKAGVNNASYNGYINSVHEQELFNNLNRE